MAEIINLATFDFDTKKLEKSLEDYQNLLFEIKKEQKSYADQSRDLDAQLKNLAKQTEYYTKSKQTESKVYKDLVAKMKSVETAQLGVFQKQKDSSIQQSKINSEYAQTVNVYKSLLNGAGELTTANDALTAALGREINTRGEAKKNNIEINKLKDQLNVNIKEEADLLDLLNKKVDENNELLKQSGSANEKLKSNIGNYTEGVKDALDQTDLFNGGLGNFIDQSSKAGGAGNALTGAFSAIRVGILGALKAGLAFILTPIGAAVAALGLAVGAVVGAFKLATASLKSTEEGSQRLAVVTGAVTGVFNGLFKVIKPLGLFFANVFIKHLENVGKAAKAMAGFLADALDFVGFDETAKSVRGFTNEVVQSSVAAANLAKAEGELEKRMRDTQNLQDEYENKAEKLRQLRDDDSRGIKQRIVDNTNLGNVLKQQSSLELSLANDALKVADLRIKSEGKTTEALNLRQEALNKISEINNRITGQESEQLANLNSLRKEAADAEKERQEKATEAQLALSRARIEAFIAEQGFKRKSAEEEYAFNYELYNKEYADLKLQLQKKKITQAEFDSQMQQLRVDYLAKNSELTIENAELELQAELDKNARILDSDRYLSEQQFELKKQTLANNLKAEQDFQKLRLEQGAINEQEYNAEINRINEENRLSQEELRIEREEQAKEKALLDLENQKIINEENFLAQAEIEKQQNEIKRQQEIANADQTGADISLINAKYAKMQEDIEAAKQANKVQLASDAFGSLASIFGAESKAGKAAAIAQTTIDTYQSAISAFKSLSGIPIVGPVLGGIAAAAAVASGLKAVKQITATKTPTVSKTPSYATGVIGLRGSGSGTSDNINANLSAGESVINARSTSMFANELSAINQAGGGVGINGASNILNQNEVQNNANNSQMVQMIAEAVAIGAEAGTKSGSQSGIKELSNDRKVMADAKF